MSAIPALSPRKHPFLLPTEALAQAVGGEWKGRKRFDSKIMPLTAIAFTALDVVAENRGKMVEAMLAYAETDLLLYRSETPELLRRQQEAWDPVLAWADARYEISVKVTQGVMPVEQARHTLNVLRRAVEALDDFALAAFSVLTRGFGSCLLALAVSEGQLESRDAFALSRVDEDYQAELWGEDSVMLGRAREIERDVCAAAEFLRLLEKSQRYY